MERKATERGDNVEAGPVKEMSDDFLKVVERIQQRLRGIPRSMEVAHLEQITAAEHEVDSCAVGMRDGSIEPRLWQEALVSYEDAWMKMVESLGDRRN